MIQRTLSIVKPDGVGKNAVGNVISRFEKAGLKVVALRMVRLSEAHAGAFYAVHAQRPFYGDLKRFISSGPIVPLVLEGENAIARTREIMGATNPKEAKPGTIRADLAESIDQNVVHGSDSPESAAFEIPFFFSALEIHPRG